MTQGAPPPAAALPSDHPLTEAARQWLAVLQRCVRAVDYEAAETLVDPDVLAFGTYASIVAGRSALRREQWERVWPAIREFTFRLDEVRCVGNDRLLCVIAPWDSVGVKSDGATYPRPGRATLVLLRRERWVAVHSHFSLVPGTGNA
jgi:ketosteroid isomerase-like protein